MGVRVEPEAVKAEGADGVLGGGSPVGGDSHENLVD